MVAPRRSPLLGMVTSTVILTSPFTDALPCSSRGRAGCFENELAPLLHAELAPLLHAENEVNQGLCVCVGHVSHARRATFSFDGIA
jgi:hypothetical protein